MRFQKFCPSENLRPYIRHYAISESMEEKAYKVFPSPGLVIGFQYTGQLMSISDGTAAPLSSAGITGLSDRYKVFKNSAGIGTVLVYFTETGVAHFAGCPVNELFNQSISIDNLFDRGRISEMEERLAAAQSDLQKIKVVENFLLSQLKLAESDRLVVEAVRLIYKSGGTVKIKELAGQLCIGQGRFEKRFRQVVGASPKKFASIIRFNCVLNSLAESKSLTDICYENNFFDQSHFIKDFRQFTGDSPENFRKP